VQWIYDLAVSVKASGMGGHLFGAVIDSDHIRSGVDGQRFAHQVVGDRITIGIKDHHGGLGGLDRWMDQDMVPWFLGKGPEFLLWKQLGRFFLRGPVDGMVFMLYPFLKGLIEGL
jgi:hypothetical protein